ncbi:MAG TPA: hypothetical protein VJ840_16315 [Gemmatimonadaceae bacterium]|nr:hypothetical protein [Gemmatimonadaceae bacterium]
MKEEISRDDAQLWVANAVMTPEASKEESSPDDIPNESRQLAFLIGQSFCAFQQDGEEARLFATRVLHCLEQVNEPDAVIDLLPLIRHHEDFSILVKKYQRGLISRSGFRSIVQKRFTFDDVRFWLAEASIDQLESLVGAIENSEFALARPLLALPAA